MQIKSILAGATIALAASLTSVGAEEPARQLGYDVLQFATLNGITAAPLSTLPGRGLTPLTPLQLASVRGADLQLLLPTGRVIIGNGRIGIYGFNPVAHACITITAPHHTFAGGHCP